MLFRQHDSLWGSVILLSQKRGESFNRDSLRYFRYVGEPLFLKAAFLCTDRRTRLRWERRFRSSITWAA